MSTAQAPRALIIQDHDGISRMLAGAFKAAGYVVDETLDGEEGVAKARTGDYTLICVDDILSDMNGFEIMRALKAQAFAGAVFFTSSSPDFVRLALAHGAHHAVMIPFDLADVTAEARAVTARA